MQTPKPILLILLLVTLSASKFDYIKGVFADEYDTMIDYDRAESEEWDTYACVGFNSPDSGVFNEIAVLSTYPRCGYPMRRNLFVGLNDTIEYRMRFYNMTTQAYVLTGKKPKEWFTPGIWQNLDKSNIGKAYRDSSRIGYRLRRWERPNSRKSQMPDTLAKLSEGWDTMVVDLWNLVPGHYSLCLVPNSLAPSNFMAMPGGRDYIYVEAQSAADTINAFEACFWRVVGDSNYTAALNWLNEILIVNQTSVPGWWLRGDFYHYYDLDASKAVDAYDKAIEFLDQGADPLMPDSTQRLLLPAEKNYLYWCRQQLAYERARFAP